MGDFSGSLALPGEMYHTIGAPTMRISSSKIVLAAASLRDDLTTYRGVILAIGLLSLAAFGFGAFNVSLTGDDWSVIHDSNAMVPWFIAVGRWMAIVVGDLFFASRIAVTASLLLSLALMFLGVFIVARAMRLRNHHEIFLFIALWLFHPVMAEQIAYKMNHLPIGFGMLATCLAIAMLYRTVGQPINNRWAIDLSAGLLLLFATGIQQTFWLLGVSLSFAFSLGEPANDKPCKWLSHRCRVYVPALLGSLVGYFGITRLIQRYYDIHPSDAEYQLERSIISSPDQLAVTIKRFFSYMDQFLFRGQHLWPSATKFAFLLLLIIAAIGLLWKWRRSESNKSVAPASLILLRILCLIGLLVTPWLLGLVRLPDNSYRYNALLALLPIYPVIICLLLRSSAHRVFMTGIWVLSGYIVLSFVFFQNVAAIALYTTNTRDISTVQRIISRVESHAEYPRASRLWKHSIYLVGNLSADRSGETPLHKLHLQPFGDPAPGPMSTSAVECGVFNCQPQRFWLIARMVDYPTRSRTYRQLERETFAKFPAAQQDALLDRVCEADVWPHADAIQVVDEKFFVFLSRPQWLMSRCR